MLGVWIDKVLSELGCEIEYFPGRNIDFEGSTFDEDKMQKYGVNLPNAEKIGDLPDKSILFSYAAIQESIFKNNLSITKSDALETIAYYMAMGYEGKYKLEKRVKEGMQHPYDNIVEFVKKEGFAECVTFTEDNKEFFISRKMQHMKTDYFHMYMNLLQQSYSVLNMTKELGGTLSAEHEVYKDGDRATSEKLEEIETKINLFLIKNVKASVSHVENQNDFYSYVEEGLHIKEDIEALNNGVAALEEILRRRDSQKEQEKNDRIQAALTLLTIVTIPTMLSDFFDIYNVIYGTDADAVWTPLHTPTLIGVGIIFCFVLFNAKTLFHVWFKKKGK